LSTSLNQLFALCAREPLDAARETALNTARSQQIDHRGAILSKKESRWFMLDKPFCWLVRHARVNDNVMTGRKGTLQSISGLLEINEATVNGEF
jgi:hypothetical protein